MKDKPQLAVILLAAGKSSRLGQLKQLISCNGQSLLQKQCELALSVSETVSCVLGFKATQLQKHLSCKSLSKEIITLEDSKLAKVKLVVNNDWQKGMSSSIVTGITNLDKTVDGVLILLVDQWRLSKIELQVMISRWQNDFEHNVNNIVVAGKDLIGNERVNDLISTNDVFKPIKEKEQKLGPPVIFPRKYFKELRQLSGEKGARLLLTKYQSELTIIDYPKAFDDIDTPEQLKKMIELEKQQAQVL